MNCAKGDLAFVVKSMAGNEGRIVRCVMPVGPRSFWMPDGEFREFVAWQIDPPLVGIYGFTTNHMPDEFLRPIRDQPGEDEILRIAGLPADHKETV